MIKNKNEADKDVLMVESENQFIYESYVVRVPISEDFLNDSKKVKSFASRTVKRHLGDEVEVSKIQIHKPGIVKKSVVRIFRRQPMANLVVVTRF
jgi:hypothetical protein